VLKIERQVLKRRVKRDFLDARAQQQAPHARPATRPPASGGPARPAQFARPANQGPLATAVGWRSGQQQQHAAERAQQPRPAPLAHTGHAPFHPLAPALLARTHLGPGSLGAGAEAILMEPSGPLPSFQSSEQRAHGPTNQSAQLQTPAGPPTPLQRQPPAPASPHRDPHNLANSGNFHNNNNNNFSFHNNFNPNNFNNYNRTSSNQLQSLVQATQQQQQQQQLPQNHSNPRALFNDPTWPLMWYLVSTH